MHRALHLKGRQPIPSFFSFNLLLLFSFNHLLFSLSLSLSLLLLIFHISFFSSHFQCTHSLFHLCPLALPHAPSLPSFSVTFILDTFSLASSVFLYKIYHQGEGQVLYGRVPPTSCHRSLKIFYINSLVI